MCPVSEGGEILWEINLGSPVVGYPITYPVWLALPDCDQLVVGIADAYRGERPVQVARIDP